MKQAIHKAAVGIVGLSLCATYAAKATSITITDISDWSKAEVVNLTLTSPTLGSSYDGGVYSGINTFQITANGVTFDANGFCIDPYHWSVGGTYSDDVVNLSNAPKSPGPMTPQAALDVEKLWAEYYTAALTDSSVAGGLQLAIWEVVANSIGNSEYFSIDAGQSGPGQIGDVALQDIASLATYSGPLADLVGLTSPTGQDYVVANFVPSGSLPPSVPDQNSTFALLGMGMVALAAAPRSMLKLSRIKSK
ncbi:MAG TPA: hypothetical protein VHB20_19450 [Verrucomicrobiae bacterium]|nr:hypothetical protein [Verrucomicrobiae bacterium]